MLYDAVAILATNDGATGLAAMLATKDSVSDAFGYARFIAFNGPARALSEAAALTDFDEGMVEVSSTGEINDTVTMLSDLRYWQRLSDVE